MAMSDQVRRDVVLQILQTTYNWSKAKTQNEMDMEIASMDRYLNRYIRDCLTANTNSKPPTDESGVMKETVRTVAGFKDANGMNVKEGDEVEYRLGQRRGVLVYCGQDGASMVHFFDTGREEDVNWIHLCGVPETHRTK